MIALVFCLSAMLGLLADSSSDRADKAVREGPIGEIPYVSRTFALTVHDPILIDGDSEFTNASGVTWGSGTESDPYIIEGWNIDLSLVDIPGIEIRYANSYFIVRNVSVHGDGYESAMYSYDTGISLLYASNAAITDCIVSSNDFGVGLYGCQVVVTDCNLQSNGFGVYMTSCWHSVTNGNNVSQNMFGISMERCWDTTICGNNISQNTGWGFSMYDCEDISIWSNVFVSDGMAIGSQPGELAYYNSHAITMNNTVNGKPLCYYKNGNDLELNDVQIGQLIVVNYTDVHVTNLSITNTDCGISMAYVANASVALNNVSADDYGMRIFSCRNASIDGNLAYDNHYGLSFYGSKDIVISSNIVSNTSEEAIKLGNCQNSTISGNSVLSSHYRGIALYSCGNTTALGNNIQSNPTGSIIQYCSNTTITSNKVADNDNGMIFENCANMTVTGNNVSNNEVGIWLTLSDSSVLTGNTCSNNGCGIYLDTSSNNSIVNNNCSNNTYGVYLDSSTSSSISNNYFSDNGQYALILDLDSNGNVIWNNTFYHNNGATDHYNHNHIQASDDGTDNSWNNTSGYGNNWSDWTTPDKLPPFGVVDSPYEISGSATAADNYPLTTSPSEPIPEFGMMAFVVLVLLIVVVLAGKARRKNAYLP